jgi:hypothetical protein
MSFRPALFSPLGDAFAQAFGNVDCLFTINGVAQASTVRGILRQTRAVDLGQDEGQAVEGTRHTLKVAASSVPGLTSDRDSVAIGGITYPVGNIEDDGRSMLRIVLDGDI